MDDFSGSRDVRLDSHPACAGVCRTSSRTLVPTPIILTTAFVIFGAWRSAVRDAEVEAVDEDECQLTDG